MAPGEPSHTEIGNGNEIALLRNFVNFAVPSILVAVEPGWKSARDALLRLSNSCSPLRHAICAFSALTFGESLGVMPSATAPLSTYHANLATNGLQILLDKRPSSDTDMESILATVFFLSYVELIVSDVSKTSLELINRAHDLVSSKQSILYQQLLVWLTLLGAKILSDGGQGVPLHANPETRDPEAVRENHGSSNANGESNSFGDSILETEEILFNSLNRKANDFNLQVLHLSSRISRLNEGRRSRGSVQDELEVMLAAEKISASLNALWALRPAILDLADESDQLHAHLSAELATKVEEHLRIYTADFHACFIQLQRVAYAHLRPTPQVRTAVAKIMHLARLMGEEGRELPVGMLWPLMMAACEAEDDASRAWLVESIEGMQGDAVLTAQLAKEVLKRQKGGQRADVRAVMRETFGQVFPINGR